MAYIPNIDLPVVPCDYIIIKQETAEGTKIVAYGCKRGLVDFVSNDVESVVNFAINQLQKKRRRNNTST